MAGTHTEHRGGFLGIGGEDVEVANPLTLADVVQELPEGWTLDQVVLHDATGKVITDRAAAPTTPLQPGMTIQIKGPSGRVAVTHVNDDASDVQPWTQTAAGARTAPNMSLPTDGTPLARQTALRDQAVARYNDPATEEGEKPGLLTLIHQAETQIRALSQDELKASGKDEDTQALARAAAAKAKAGQTPTQQELAAYFKVNARGGAGATGQYAAPIEGYSGPIAPHHAGEGHGAVDLFAPPGTPVRAAVSGAITRAGPFGAAGNDILIIGDDGRVYDYEHVDGLQVKPGDRVTAGQPLAVVATLENGGSSVGPTPHLHFAVGNTAQSIDYGNHGTADDFDTLGFVKNLYDGKTPGGAGDLVITPKPEMHTLGDKLYRVNPDGTASVVIDASGEKAPTTHQLGNVLYQYDPSSKSWKQAIVGAKSASDLKAEQDMKGKFQVALQQAHDTKDYISKQLASGAITTEQAQQYQGMNEQYLQAALQGTTPWDMYKEQQQQDQQRATLAKDLLNKKLETQATMADSMLGHAITGVTGSKYGQLAPGTLSGLYEGVMKDVEDRAGGPQMSSLVQGLLQSIAPKAAAAGLDPRLPVIPGAPAGALNPNGQPPIDTSVPADQQAA